jgi:hypothetical protein
MDFVILREPEETQAGRRAEMAAGVEQNRRPSVTNRASRLKPRRVQRGEVNDFLYRRLDLFDRDGCRRLGKTNGHTDNLASFPS